MAAQWRIFRDGQVMGPMSAAEIREGLRTGTVEPFDLVARDGSQIRVELVEVDEIFATDASDDKGAPSASPQTAAPPQPKPNPRPNPKAAGRPENFVDSDSRDKKFILIDKRRGTLGPLSAAEIQSLFFRGILERTVRVGKVDSKQTVPLAQFIATYAGQRLNALSVERTGTRLKSPEAVSTGLPRSSVTEELMRGIRVKNTINNGSFTATHVAAIIGVLLLLLIGIFLALPDSVFVQEVARPRGASPNRIVNAHPRRDDLRRRLTRRPPPGARPLALAEAPPSPVTPTQTRPASSDGEKTPPAIARGLPRTDKAPIDPRGRGQSRRPAERRQRFLPPGRSNVKTKAAEARGQPPPAQQDALDAKVGRLLILTNMLYDPQALDSCTLKCRLPLTAPTGRRLTGVFFKAAFHDKLKSLGGRARISGSLSKDEEGYTIFINKVE